MEKLELQSFTKLIDIYRVSGRPKGQAAKNRHECNFNFQHVTYLNMSLATYPSRASPTKDRKGVSTQLGEKLGPDVTERMLSLSSDCTLPQEDPSGLW
ncbi:hypothetical protein CFAM422_000618 [Trichoderma lentiforme]|uniref:Uncharacterized protein n=1 Tax=Trichoderma lentiforme TaxID=1567552 RepID=A0A9P4XQI7_9HYPO|nr:hypothetical protein CFAM422_000618 [Trichoderma lentiforme]